jgi:hypothetical protein
MGGTDGRAHGQANTCAFVLCGIHPSVVFHSEELLQDVLAGLRWDARAGIRHGIMQDRPVPRPGILPGHRDPYDASGRRILQGVGQDVVISRRTAVSAP